MEDEKRGIKIRGEVNRRKKRASKEQGVGVGVLKVVGGTVAGGEASGLVAGPSPCDLQEAGGHPLTRHRHRKRALAQERNTIRGFSQSYSPPGTPRRRAEALKQPRLVYNPTLSVFPLFTVSLDIIMWTSEEAMSASSQGECVFVFKFCVRLKFDMKRRC